MGFPITFHDNRERAQVLSSRILRRVMYAMLLLRSYAKHISESYLSFISRLKHFEQMLNNCEGVDLPLVYPKIWVGAMQAF